MDSAKPIEFDVDKPRFRRQLFWGIGALAFGAFCHFALPGENAKGVELVAADAIAILCLVAGLTKIVTAFVSVSTRVIVTQEAVELHSPLYNWKAPWLALDLVELIRPKEETKDGPTYVTIRFWKEKKQVGEIDLTLFSISYAKSMVDNVRVRAMSEYIAIKKV